LLYFSEKNWINKVISFVLSKKRKKNHMNNEQSGREVFISQDREHLSQQ
jgi:hypothetical protein